MEQYLNFDDLKQYEKEGKDYLIRFREGCSGTALFAPHGGGIEPGTVEIADEVAGNVHTLYAFKGIKKEGNAVLHIQSVKFDEPKGIRTAGNAETVVSIHGHHGKNEVVFIGGKNQELKGKIRCMLNKSGFHAQISTELGLSGQHPRNICNRSRTGKGVQLEISRGLREKMFDNLSTRTCRKKTKLFYEFVETLREALL